MCCAKYLLFLISTHIFVHSSYGCQMDGVADWRLVVEEEILDIHRGVFFSRSTTDIEAITGRTSGGGADSTLYLDVSLVDSYFNITTTDAFELYEENETAEFLRMTVNFRCTGGIISSLLFDIRVTDTNNNAPAFRPTDVYELTITPPLPPGFQITGCLNEDIIVRDIDLTTESIEFTIEENPYFEIAYNGRATDPKEFVGILRTKDLIRSLPGVVELTISATDVDRTGDPPITTNAIIRIQADDEFDFPEEPVFSQPFYIASYTEDEELVIEQPITLRQGYHESVVFSLDGDHTAYFALVLNRTEISIRVTQELPNEVLRSERIILVVRAEREHTSGATTTVIVELPQVFGLEFEQAQYTGTIVDNVLQAIQLTLTQGYEHVFNVTLQNEFATYFEASIEGNVVTLSMRALDDSIIDTNNFITIQVTAANEYSAAIALVTLDIIKDDTLTPVFEKAIYSGEYDRTSGLAVEQIILQQGYDETVIFSLQGDHSTFFQLTQDGPVLSLTSDALPVDILMVNQLLLTVEANKPRFVTASAGIVLTMPAARELRFSAPIYKGTLLQNELSVQPVIVLPLIVLDVGYDDDVTFDLAGEHAEFFTTLHEQGEVTISASSAIPDNVIIENSFLTLIVQASGTHAVPTSTSVVLDIIKQDITTPVFTEHIYRAIYSETSSIEIGNISLAQGFDDDVTFSLEGEHAQYFTISNFENEVTLLLETNIPPEIIYTEKVLLFNILAEKHFTVGANAVISITFPPELTEAAVMKFSKNTYVGSIQDEILTLENVVLETGYENGTQFTLFGEHASLFSLQESDGIILISLEDAIPTDITETNPFLVLEIEATRKKAVTVSTSIVIHIVREEIDVPVFTEAYYRGVYSTELQFVDEISLSQGYDDTVTFELEGENSAWFAVVPNGNSATITLANTSGIPENVLNNNDHLLFTVVALKPGSINGRATIFIDLPKEVPEPVIIRFSQSSYVGRIENGELFPPTITFLGDRDPIQLNFTGDYASYFEVTQVSNSVQILLINQLPTDIQNLPFIILNIEASYPEAINGHTAVILEIIKLPQIVAPVFEQAYYVGEYLEQELQFQQSIRLIQGFDESVVFTLAGDDSRWFDLEYIDENNLSLTVIYEGLEQITNRSHLIFSIVANKPDSVPGRAAVIINLADFSTATPVRFSENFYMGSIQNGNLTLSVITIQEGYSANMTYDLSGEYEEFFAVIYQENNVTLQLLSELPNEVVEANNIIVLTLEAHIEKNKAQTVVILEVIKPELTALAFEESYYVGSYSIMSGSTVFDPQITLTEEHDETVSFSLEGGDGQWFEIEENENYISIIQVNPIPNEIISNRQQLVFVILAEKSGALTARTTIIISIVDDITVLEFEKNQYIGSIENNEASIETINLIAGFSENTTFTLIGDLSNYFTITSNESTVTISLQTAIPEDVIPKNRLIVLEIQASAPNATSTYTAVIFGVIAADVSILNFSEAYYIGVYTEAEGLHLHDTISLVEDIDGNTEITLIGEHSQYFAPVISNNTVQIETVVAIPPAVVLVNQHIIFTIHANREGSIPATATIVISLLDNYDDGSILGFDRVSYLGSVESDNISLPQITLTAGYSENVSFILHGDLSNYFYISNEEAVINISLISESPIPEESIPENGIIILELQATAPDAISAYATIILHIPQEQQFEQVLFSETYYTGSYSESEGLTFENAITLTDGIDESIEFYLEGEYSGFFNLVAQENSVILIEVNSVPSDVLRMYHNFLFVIRAVKPGTSDARATIVISLLNDIESQKLTVLRFERVSYLGSIEDGTSNLDSIVLREGFSENVTFSFDGDLSSYFNLSNIEEEVTISLQTAIPDELIPENRIIILELQATANEAVTAYATVVFNVALNQSSTTILLFNEPYYTGEYTEAKGLIFDEITLLDGPDEAVHFSLEGDSSQYFELVEFENSLILRVATLIPPSVINNNQHLIFSIRAEKPNAVPARATILVSFPQEFTGGLTIGFDRVSYLGFIENNTVNLDPIILSEGYNEAVWFTIYGDLVNYFAISNNEDTVTVILMYPIPEELISDSQIIILELRASAPDTISAHATIIFNIIREDPADLVILTFNMAYYTGFYTAIEGLTFDDVITLSQGYENNTIFALEGDDAQYFEAVVSGNSVTLRVMAAIPPTINNNQHLIFTILAERTNAVTARATIVISLRDEITQKAILGFNRISYVGTIENNVANLEDIILTAENAEDVSFVLHGALAQYFDINVNNTIISILLQTAISEASLPSNDIVVLELQANAIETMSAFATIVFEIVRDDLVELEFSEQYYTGQYTTEGSLEFEEQIVLTRGYEESVIFDIIGEYSQWFDLFGIDNTLTLTVNQRLPEEVLDNNRKLILVVTATKPESSTAKATIIISLPNDAEECEVDSDVRFERILFEGQVQGDQVQHENINVFGYEGEDSNVQIVGVYANLFTATLTNGEVKVERVGSVDIPADINYVALQLQLGPANAVLLLQVIHSEEIPELPIVLFSSPSYSVQVDITQTGLIGQVQATADNGEDLTYSVDTENAHLLERISIRNAGELHLSAPANRGVYLFDVIATTVFSRASATAQVTLTVEAITICSEDNFVLPPLQILDRDEEAAHRDLIVLNTTEFEGCQYQLINRWPIDQQWLYVDENGLHTTAIDREDEAIAFMALSQVQVELILECDTDDVATRRKRSVNSGTRDHLGPYDYGNSKWILTDTIQYNARRSLVNLIVNDINDNAPIFVGKENEPIVVAYPIPELEERILPRALAEVHATDADVGENAALVYWSQEEVLAVSPQTGSVHVKNVALLENNTILTVFATDQNGQGLSGTLDLLVKLVDTSHVAVVTVKNAFLDDEETILNNLSDAVGYDVRGLRSTVISSDTESETDEPDTRKKREAVLSTGASLQLYVYGLIESEPVDVNQLTGDINSVITVVDVVSTLSLEDHLEALEICALPGRDTGLLVSTIVLAVLLFILIAVAAVWFFLKWRKERNYEQFSDRNSIASQSETLPPAPKPESISKPRINIDDLKKSERRLQDMLEAPVDKGTIEPSPSKATESKVTIPDTPIVIQSIDKLKDKDLSDDEDEFGERVKMRKKSVVTFNENVEKFIHVEDPPDDSDYEVYKL